MAARAAASAMSATVVSGFARRRETIPVRWRIHSSEELMGPTISSLTTTFSPRTPPTPRMRACWVGWAASRARVIGFLHGGS